MAVFVGVLSIAEGFRAAMTVSGPQDVAIVLRAGADQSLSVTTIQNRLRKAGHQRSLAAITSRLTTLGLLLRRDAWTASDVSRIFDIDTHVVRRWIASGSALSDR